MYLEHMLFSSNIKLHLMLTFEIIYLIVFHVQKYGEFWCKAIGHFIFHKLSIFGIVYTNYNNLISLHAITSDTQNNIDMYTKESSQQTFKIRNIKTMAVKQENITCQIEEEYVPQYTMVQFPNPNNAQMRSLCFSQYQVSSAVLFRTEQTSNSNDQVS